MTPEEMDQYVQDNIFGPARAARPVDERIPKHWRDGFERFTGLQPTYEEYQTNPEMWVEDPPVDVRIAVGVALVVVILSVITFLTS